MKNQQRAREKFLNEINTFEKKLQGLKNLVDRNRVSLEVLVKRAKDDSNNFCKKMEAVEKMAPKNKKRR